MTDNQAWHRKRAEELRLMYEAGEGFVTLADVEAAEEAAGVSGDPGAV